MKGFCPGFETRPTWKDHACFELVETSLVHVVPRFGRPGCTLCPCRSEKSLGGELHRGSTCRPNHACLTPLPSGRRSDLRPADLSKDEVRKTRVVAMWRFHGRFQHLRPEELGKSGVYDIFGPTWSSTSSRRLLGVVSYQLTRSF